MARHKLTSVIHLIARAGVFAAVLIGLAPHAFAACASPAEFGRWLQGFKKEAVAQGISPNTVSYALDGLSYDPATIAKDRAQGVFAQTFLQFSGRMVSGNRLQVGGAAAQEVRQHLQTRSSSNTASPVRCSSPSGDWRPISAR